MRFSTAAIFAFVSAVVAQNPTADFDPIHTPTEDQAVVAGSTVDITWDYLPKYNGTVTIVLIGGPDVPHQVTVATLASKLDNSLGKYSWTVDKTLGSAKVYGIQINYDADPTIFQWGFHFSITGGASTSGTGSASVSAPTTTASTSGSTSYSASTPATTTLTSVTTSAYPTTTVSSISDSSPVGGGVSTTTAPAGNLSTTAGPSKTTAATTTGPSTIPNAGAALAASSFALVGCLAAAVLAL